MPDVWAIDGVEVPAAVARAVAYASSGGAEGVVEPEGLKVAPLDVPFYSGSRASWCRFGA